MQARGRLGILLKRDLLSRSELTVTTYDIYIYKDTLCSPFA